MYHGLTNDFLYSAYKLEVELESSSRCTCNISGTCFFIQNQNGKLNLITNRHMLDPSYMNEGYQDYEITSVKVTGKQRPSNNSLPVTDNSFNVVPNVIFDDDYHNDVACIREIQTLDTDEVIISFYLSYDLLAKEDDFTTKLSICDFLAFPGFPEWYDREGNRPILRTGTISSDPRSDYSYGGRVRGACVAYEAFSYGGSSGSPIFAVQKGPKPGPGISFPGYRRLMLVGINAGHLQLGASGQHSGISYFYKSTVIDRLINL